MDIFCKIINKEIPAEIVYEDEHVLAFKDINPVAPIHILIIPKSHMENLNDIPEEGDHQYILNAAKIIAKQLNVESGYRIVINCGESAGQTVFHLHAHLLAGRELSWPPG